MLTPNERSILYAQTYGPVIQHQINGPGSDTESEAHCSDAKSRDRALLDKYESTLSTPTARPFITPIAATKVEQHDTEWVIAAN